MVAHIDCPVMGTFSLSAGGSSILSILLRLGRMEAMHTTHAGVHPMDAAAISEMNAPRSQGGLTEW